MTRKIVFLDKDYTLLSNKRFFYPDGRRRPLPLLYKRPRIYEEVPLFLGRQKAAGRELYVATRDDRDGIADLAAVNHLLSGYFSCEDLDTSFFKFGIDTSGGICAHDNAGSLEDCTGIRHIEPYVNPHSSDPEVQKDIYLARRRVDPAGYESLWSVMVGDSDDIPDIPSDPYTPLIVTEGERTDWNLVSRVIDRLFIAHPAESFDVLSGRLRAGERSVSLGGCSARFVRTNQSRLVDVRSRESVAQENRSEDFLERLIDLVKDVD